MVANRAGVAIWPLIGWQIQAGSGPLWLASAIGGEAFVLPAASGWVT